MQPWSSRQELISKVIELRKKGTSRNGIARAMKVSPNTVGKILRTHKAAREEPHSVLPVEKARAPRATKLDDHKKRISELLEKFDDITAQRVFEEIRGDGYTGAYTAVKVHVAKVRPEPKPKASLEVEASGPGEVAESDWTPHTITFTDGQKAEIDVYDYVLRYSTRKKFIVYESCDIYALMDAHVRTFNAFKGAAKTCKFDSQKPVVLYWEGEQPIYNPQYLAFAAHYEYVPVACRRGKPNDKPRCERAFWEYERSFLNAREFRNLEDFKTQSDAWNETICDGRPHKKLRRPRMELFREEQEHLVPLPTHQYDTARFAYKLCDISGYVAWGGNRYAVPYDHVTDFLPTRITASEILIYGADLSLVARHELAPRSAGLDLDPEGLHRRMHARQSAIDFDQLEKAFIGMGEIAADFFASMKKRAPRISGYSARQILLLRARYSSSDIEQALRRAGHYGAYEAGAVERILEATAKPRKLEEYVSEKLLTRFGNAARRASAGPRDLAEYDALQTHRNEEGDSASCQNNPIQRSSKSDSGDTSKS